MVRFTPLPPPTPGREGRWFAVILRGRHRPTPKRTVIVSGYDPSCTAPKSAPCIKDQSGSRLSDRDHPAGWPRRLLALFVRPPNKEPPVIMPRCTTEERAVQDARDTVDHQLAGSDPTYDQSFRAGSRRR